MKYLNIWLKPHVVLKLSALLVAHSSVATASPGTQEQMSAQTIVSKASLAQYYSASDGRALVRLRISDNLGRKMTRQFVVLRKDQQDNGHQKFLVRFERPEDVRDTVFLVHKTPEDDDDRWLYLPALDLVKRIAASDERTSFVGSHLFYEDISGRSPTEDNHKVVEETKNYWMIDSHPKKPKKVEFKKYRVKIRKRDYLPESILYFNLRNEPIRKIEAARIETIGGHPTITRLKVSDLRKGGFTLAAFGRIRYDLGVPDEVFTERSLRNPPAQWLRAQ